MTEQDSTQTGEAKTEEEFSLKSVKKHYFPPNELAKAAEVMQQISDHIPADQTKMNFSLEEDFPEGYGIGVIPISKRDDTKGGEGNITVGVAIVAIPDPKLVSEHEKGGSFIRDIIIDYFMGKIANAVRPRQDGTTAITLPQTVEDFLDRTRGRASLKAFTEYAPDFVKILRKKGLKLITTSILRQLLQSSAFAAAQFPKIPQDRWVIILNAIIAKASEDKHDTAVLVNWLQTRDQATATQVDDLDLSDLDSMMAGDTSATGETETEPTEENTSPDNASLAAQLQSTAQPQPQPQEMRASANPATTG